MVAEEAVVDEPVVEPVGEEAEAKRASSETSKSASNASKASKPADKPASGDGLRRRLIIAALLYVVCSAVFAWVAGDRTESHTMNNHFAVQAEVWKQGRWYLTEEDITARARRGELDMYNDWAIVRKEDPVTHKVEVRYYNSFPLFPAVVMYPFVSMAGSALMFRDGLFVVLVAGIGPALFFLALESLRAQKRLARSQIENAGLALAYAFGTVYFFSAVQGTVWFAAHVVAAALTGGYLLCAFRADKIWWCALAGVLVGCGYHTRPPFILCVPLFAFEAARVSLRSPVRTDGSLLLRAGDVWGKLDLRALFVRYVVFAVPILVALWATRKINEVCYGDPNIYGHQLLNVVWMERVKRFGLFSYHYLSRNLTCAFTLLPIVNPAAKLPPGISRLQISGNGLALWVTTPLYFWLLWPKVKPALHWVLWATVVPIAGLVLLYHNSGWIQFGFRFSNDFSPYLFLLLAIGMRPFGVVFRLAAIASIAVNAFGAVSFQRRGFEKYYFLQTYSAQTYDGGFGQQSSTYPPD